MFKIFKYYLQSERASGLALNDGLARPARRQQMSTIGSTLEVSVHVKVADIKI